MTQLKEFIEAIEYKITGGSEYQWQCFGDNARYLDSNDNEGLDGTYSVSAVFDSVTQQVYSIEAWDYNNDREYQWIDPEFREAYTTECEHHDVDPAESLDGRKYIDIEEASDILEKISAILAGEDYDTRIKVPVDFSDNDLLKYMKLAHDLDITFNQLVELAIKEAIESRNLFKD